MSDMPSSIQQSNRAAFFQAVKAARPAETVRAAPPVVQEPQAAPAKAAALPSPDRPLRPGSIIDIKV